MKIGNIDGTPEEIRDFFVLESLQIRDFIEVPDPRSRKAWVLLPLAALAALLAIVLFVPGFSPREFLALLILGMGIDVWLAIVVHLCSRNNFVTWLVLIGGFALLLMAAGLLLPKEAFEFLERQKPGK